VNWNILITSGKEIKGDSMISVNESREAYIFMSLAKGNYLNKLIYINIMLIIKKIFTIEKSLGLD